MTSAATTSTTAVRVTSDVAYLEPTPRGWAPTVLDTYASADRNNGAGPLVVFLHGGGERKTGLQYPEIATTLAQAGAGVVVPNWGPSEVGFGEFLGDGTLAAQQRLMDDAVACAITYAIAHAGELGADPGRLVLVGHSAGANMAAMAALSSAAPIAGCTTPPRAWTPRGLLLWDGDWLMTDERLDVLGTGLASLLAVYSPWPSLTAKATPARFDLAVTTRSAWFMRLTCTPTTPALTLRDPTGVMTADLRAVGAFDDGAIDVVDVTKGMSHALQSHGIDATVTELAEVGTNHQSLVLADLTTLVDHVLALAG